MIVDFRPLEDLDFPLVESLAREAFWNLYVPGCDEHYLVHLLRTHEDYRPEFSLVALVDGKPAGAILYTRSRIISDDGLTLQTLSFGPLCVAPQFQRRGIGSALIQKSFALINAQEVPAVIILGDPHNYVKHGFRSGFDCGVSDAQGHYPVGLLVRELKPEALAGRKWRFAESPVYHFDPSLVPEYDRRFPPREKTWQYSQELFSIMIRATLDPQTD